MNGVYLLVFGAFLSILPAILGCSDDGEAKTKLTERKMNEKPEHKQITNPLDIFHVPKDIETLIKTINDKDYSHLVVSIEKWPEVRKAEARWWLYALQSVRKKIDRDCKYDKSPQLNVACPGPYPSGIAPESIDEPEIRKEYEKALAENKVHHFQSRLRRIEKELAPKVEDFLVKAYSKPPQAIDELRECLEEYNIEQETRSRILKRIKAY